MWLTPEHQESLAEMLDFDTTADLVRVVRELVTSHEKLVAQLEPKENAAPTDPASDATTPA